MSENDKDRAEEPELVDIWDVELDDDTEEEEEIEQEDTDDNKESSEDKAPGNDDEPSIDDSNVDDTDDEESSEELEDVPLVNSIQQILGYEFEEEFEDTDEGIAQMFEKAKGIAADQALNNLLEKYPEAKDLIEYRELGGDPDEFFKARFPETDFEKIEFKDEDERQHEMLVREDLRTKGYKEAEINADIEDFKNGGILESKAKRALDSLKAKQKEDKDSLLEKQQRQYEQQQQEAEKYWNGVKETIDKSTTFKAFSVPAKDKDEFFKYISKPVKDGKTQRDLDVEASDLETGLAVDYLMFKGFNISDIIDRKARNQNAQTLRQRQRASKLDKKEDKNTPEYTEELATL